MSIVEIDPEIEERSILPVAGKYGQGLDVEADVQLHGFEWPAVLKTPAFDPDLLRGPYAYFGFHIVNPELGSVFFDHWEPIGKRSGSNARKYLVNMGVEGAAEGRFDDETVAPRKCGIEVGTPRKEYEKDDQGRKTKVETGRVFNGFLRNVLGT